VLAEADASADRYDNNLQNLPTITTPLAVTDAAHGHCCAVNAIARCTGYVCSGGGDAAIRVWKARSLVPVRCETSCCST